MKLQTINSTTGQPEYVLLPINVYYALRNEIQEKMRSAKHQNDYIPFDPANYVDNPIALARIKAGITQEELAKRMCVTQAYVSKIERQNTVSAKVLNKVKMALKKVY
jgi:ribosome-binding protein aMBF1 (putative translation factor)